MFQASYPSKPSEGNATFWNLFEKVVVGSKSGYAQWVTFEIKNNSRKRMTIKNAQLYNSGLLGCKWYKYNNKDDELETPDNMAIHSGGTLRSFGSCGRSAAPSGASGSFDLYQDDSLVATIEFNCPWAKKSNSWGVEKLNKDYDIQFNGGSKDDGPIGDLTIIIKDA